MVPPANRLRHNPAGRTRRLNTERDRSWAEPSGLASAAGRSSRGAGVFYPEDLTQKRELEFASRALTSIEINGTYYSTFKPDSWRKWRDETPDGFVFSVKASRFCTNRKVLAEGGEMRRPIPGPGADGAGRQAGADQLAVHGDQEIRCGGFRGLPEAAAEGEGRAAPAPCAGGAQPEFRRRRQFYDLAAKYGAPSSTPRTRRRRMAASTRTRPTSPMPG